MKTFSLTAALVAILALGANGRGGGGGGGGGGRGNNGGDDASDEPGCCYGSDAKCDTTSKSTCDKFANRKGCEWRSGEDADCTFVVEPGCCFSDTGNAKCDVDDQATCEKNARRGGCEWRVGDAEDLCAIPEPDPGCCYSADFNTKCFGVDQATCEQNAKRAGCEWKTGFAFEHNDGKVTDMFGNPLCPFADLYFGDGIEEGKRQGQTWKLDGKVVIPAGGQSVSGNEVDCVGGSSCTVDADYNAVEVYSDGYVYCGGYMSCNGATVRAIGYTLRCAGELSCAGYEHECEGKGEASTIELGGCPNGDLCGVRCDGYHSCAWKDRISSDMSIIECQGEESCFGANSMYVGNYNAILCNGERSCAGVTELRSYKVTCAGFESCSGAGFNGLKTPEWNWGGWYSEAECDGARSCVDGRFSNVESVYLGGFESGVGASIEGAKVVLASGANSLQGASIIVGSSYPEVTFTLLGDNAGSGARVEHCNSDEMCSFGCSGTACRDLQVECGEASTSKCVFVSDSGDDLDCLNHSGEEVHGAYCPTVVESFDSEQRRVLAAESDSVAVCAENPINDPYRSEAWKAESPETAVWFCSESNACDTTWWTTENRAAMCTGQRSCQYTDFEGMDAISCESDFSCYSSDFWHNGDVGCSGYQACAYMDYLSTNDADDEMAVRCTGELSCFETWASPWAHAPASAWSSSFGEGAGQSFACRGKKACKQSILFNVEACSGSDACSSSTIGYNAKDLRCGGVDACDATVINHVDGAVVCAGEDSCSEVVVRDVDALYCDGYLSCSHMTGVHGVPSQIYARGRKALSECDLQSKDVNGDALELFEVFASSSKALHKTTIKCVEGSECRLFCAGNSCATMERFECSSEESCSCEGDSCPEIVVVTPQTIDGATMLSPRARAQLKQQRMEAVAVHTELTETQQAWISEPLLMLGGAGAVLTLLGAVFHLCGRKEKSVHAYEQLSKAYYPSQHKVLSVLR